MKPVLFTFENIPLIGPFPISSFGLSLLLAFIISSFTIWRITRLYDIEAERTIDMVLLTVAGTLLGARIYFVLFHLNQIDSISKLFLINHYPGLSFWGGVVGGFVSLWFFCQKYKVNFWQIADYITPGIFLALFITSLGCLFGSCQYGLPSSFGITQVGIIGKRFPLQIIEALLYLAFYLYFWRSVLKFHTPSQIVSKAIIILGFIKLFLEFFRGDSQVFFGIRLGLIWSILLILLGVLIYYKRVALPLSRRSPISDLRSILAIFVNKKDRIRVISNIRKYCYNTLVDLKVFSNRFRKNLFKLLNIKSNPSQFK